MVLSDTAYGRPVVAPPPGTGNVESQRPRRAWQLEKFAALTLLIFAILFLAAYALSRELDHDEEQFISAGALLLRFGLLPYRDYPFFQMPNLAFINSLLFSRTQYLLLSARSFNVACAAALLILFCFNGARRLGEVTRPRWLAGAGCALILGFNPLTLFTAGRAWNHDLPVLMTVSALLALWRAFKSKRPLRWFFLSGLLLGAGIGSRLTIAPLPAPFILAMLLVPTAYTSRAKALILFLTGLLVALLPAVALLAMAPAQFYFGNFTYHGPIEQLYQQSTFPYKITLLHRALFALKELAASPSALLLIVGFAAIGIWPLRRAGWRDLISRPETVTICLILPFLFVGCWIPIPPHRQYYYALIPILLLGIVYALPKDRFSPRRIAWMMAFLISLEIMESIPTFWQDKTLFRPSRWESILVHRQGMEIRKYVTRGPVLTLQPIYPLEAGLPIFNELATGPFAWRTAPFLTDRQRHAFHVMDPDNVEDFLRLHPPSAGLTGAEPAEQKLPREMLSFLQANGYLARPVAQHWMLWVSPRAIRHQQSSQN